MKTEQCSETSAYKIQMPGNYPEESIKQTRIYIKNQHYATWQYGNSNIKNKNLFRIYSLLFYLAHYCWDPSFVNTNIFSGRSAYWLVCELNAWGVSVLFPSALDVFSLLHVSQSGPGTDLASSLTSLRIMRQMKWLGRKAAVSSANV